MASSLLQTTLSLAFFLGLISLSQEASNKTEMIQQFLDGHNNARKSVGVPPLNWDNSLATYARVYANQRRRDCRLVHSPALNFGENLFWGKGHRWSAKEAVDAWVAERTFYKYNTNTCTGRECGHYTQIVWRTTKRVGCAKITCASGDSYIACEYYPPGNYVGDRPY